MREVRVQAGKAKPLWHGHPWLFADSVASVSDGEGDLVRVLDADGRPIGVGWLSEASAIRVRMLARGVDAVEEDDLLASRVRAACDLRRRLFPEPADTNAYRLVHGEGDGLPGLVVDRYADVLVAQFATKPVHARRERLSALLLASSGARSLLARPSGREAEEGIREDAIPFEGGVPAPESVAVLEAGLALTVDVHRGQKTGHYVDQRENRLLVAGMARGASVLDLYAGTAGFSLHALKAGAARATAVDSSAAAVAGAKATAEANGWADRLSAVEADVESYAKALSVAGTTFDLVVADPPRFAASRAGLAKALHAYRTLNARALSRVSPGGFLATFSCSGLVSPETFLDVVRAAAFECRRDADVLRVLTAGPDHPVSLAAPEGRYLTGLLLRVGARIA